MDPNPSKAKNDLIPDNPIITTRTLLDLSTEVLVEILAYLPVPDLFSVQWTCRTIRDIIAGTAYLQYVMRAYINGVDDFLPADFPHSERLELLRRHEPSWNGTQFNVFSKCVTDIKHPCNFILQDGYLIYERITFKFLSPQYGYVDLCSTARDEELRWVHISQDSTLSTLSPTIRPRLHLQ